MVLGIITRDKPTIYYPMVFGRMIQLLVSKQQLQQIKENAHREGFNTVSAYMRYKALNQDLVTQQQVAEIHAHLLGTPSKRKYKKNRDAPKRR